MTIIKVEFKIQEEGGRGWWFVYGVIFFERSSLIAQGSTKDIAIHLAFECIKLLLKQKFTQNDQRKIDRQGP